MNNNNNKNMNEWMSQKAKQNGMQRMTKYIEKQLEYETGK